ncbi:hypothetical protein [Streptomyces sp. NPDC052179]|uniref:hypothetical protein n=1 Tax=Streptomyces sp. NPDC052179 TaxID=3155680 RepID=UPI003433C222
MSRKYPKKYRKEQAAKLKAAEAFVESWTTSGLASTLIPDYSCTLGCEEAITYGALMRAFGYPSTAETILADHGEDCDTPHYHECGGVWTFTLQPEGVAEEEGGYTIVADGANGAEAEDRAREFLRSELKAKYRSYYYWINVEEVESGVPSSTALYSWTDIRKAA